MQQIRQITVLKLDQYGPMNKPAIRHSVVTTLCSLNILSCRRQKEMVSSKNERSWGQLLSLLKSKRYGQLDTINSYKATSRAKDRKTNIFTEGISSYSRNHEYIIYERKKAVLPPGNLLPGIKVSRDRRFNITITKQPDKGMATQPGTKLSKLDSTEPTTNLPRIHGMIKIKRDLEPPDDAVPQIESVTDTDEKDEQKDDVGLNVNESGNEKLETRDEYSNSVEKVIHGPKRKKRKYLKKKRKVMKVPLFQSMTVTPTRKEIALSCALTYDINNGEGSDFGEVKQIKAMRNQLIPIMHQQVSPKDSSSTKERKKSYQQSLACSSSKLFDKNSERYVAQFGVPPNPPPSAELFGLSRKGTV